MAQRFVYNLKGHLLQRLRAQASLPELTNPTRTDLSSVHILDDDLFSHKVMRINYDTYDMRRDQDSINPDSHPDIMMLAPQSYGHPYYYARVLSIHHVYAGIVPADQIAPESWQQFYVCFVRWFEVDFDALRPRRPIPLRWARLDEDAFGFVNPDEVIRASHIVPVAMHGRSNDALPAYSSVRTNEDTDQLDWNRHEVNQYVLLFLPLLPLLNMFVRHVDRDMFMRYLGGAPGHTRQGSRAPPNMPSQGDSDSQIAAGLEDPCDEDVPCVGVARHGNMSQEDIEEEEEDWYKDDDEEDVAPHDFSEEEDIPGDDEYIYGLAGLTM